MAQRRLYLPLSSQDATGVLPAIVYGAKSTDDPRGSIPTQIKEATRAAVAEGREIAGTYSDTAASAYHGSRGESLETALLHAENLARRRGACKVWVQHSDRLARGDGVHAAHLVEYVLRGRRCGFRFRSVQDPHTFDDLIHAVLMGERGTGDNV